MGDALLEDLIASRPAAPVIRRLAPDSYVSGAGRRSFFDYRNLDIGSLTNQSFGLGMFRARNQGDLLEPTGWHYHVLQMQIGLYLTGFIDILFEDGRSLRVSGGDCMFLPPGFRHNEIRKSADLSGVEITIPTKIETVPCDAPPAFANPDYDALRADIERRAIAGEFTAR